MNPAESSNAPNEQLSAVPPEGAPKELWQVALDAIAVYKRVAHDALQVNASADAKAWETSAMEYLADKRNRLLCDALYRKLWFTYIAEELAAGRTISRIRSADKINDYPSSDSLYPLVNAVVMEREHNDNRAIVNQILEEYESEHPPVKPS